MDLKLLNITDKEYEVMAKILTKSRARTLHMIVRGQTTCGMSYAGISIIDRLHKELEEVLKDDKKNM